MKIICDLGVYYSILITSVCSLMKLIMELYISLVHTFLNKYGILDVKKN